MLRWLYIRLIWLHPAPFRWQFGDDMLDDFDRAALRARPRYFADAIASLARQWLLRPEYRHETMPVSLQASGAPQFRSLETYKPHPAALLQGGLLAILPILLAVVSIGKSGAAGPFLIGAHFSRSGPVSVDRNSLTGSDLHTAVKLPPDQFDAWLRLARSYFSTIPILSALDADRDLTLSPTEIANASVVLRKLDRNRGGDLTAQECGLHIDPHFVSPALLVQLHRRFMSYHPVLAALDTDRDGEISSGEIEHAAAALRTLDRNHDGYLTADELIPVEMAVHAGLR